MPMVEERISRLRENIGRICRKSGRDPADVTLIAVTKFASIEKIQQAVACGITHVGENKVQEACKKFPSLDGDSSSISVRVTKHMIGHLQTNKVKAALEVFDVIQSVDSLKLAREIEKQAKKLKRKADVLIQVNASGEEQKYGFAQEDVLSALDEIAGYEHVNVLGLMTMAPLVEDTGVLRRCFRDLRNIRDRVTETFPGKSSVQMKYLSMGMTHDYEIALEEGANMVRIGRAIFSEECSI